MVEKFIIVELHSVFWNFQWHLTHRLENRFLKEESFPLKKRDLLWKRTSHIIIRSIWW